MMFTTLFAFTLLHRVSAQCTTAAGCSAGGTPSVCTVVREQSTRCASIAQGPGACVSYARPGTPFLPYGSYGAGTKRTASLFRLQACQGNIPLRLVDTSFPDPSFPYAIREDRGPGDNAGPQRMSDDSLMASPPAYPVNELFKARFLILLDMSSSMAPFYSTGGLQSLYQQISLMANNQLFTQYSRSGTEPFEFAIFAFAGERRLLQLTQWSAFTDGAAAVLLPGFSTDWLGNRYPFADDSSAFYWAVPEAIRTLQERSAAGRAADLLPFQLDCLIVVSDGFDTAGFAPTGARAPQNPFSSYDEAVIAASTATQPIRFITFPAVVSGSDAFSPNAVAARRAMSSKRNSFEVDPGFDSLANLAIAGCYTSFLANDVPDTQRNANSLLMFEFCPTYKGAGPAAGIQVNALTTSVASPAPPPANVVENFPYPAPPDGRCVAVPSSPPPTPTRDPCDPIFSPTPFPTASSPSACLFFGGSACGRTGTQTDAGFRLVFNCGVYSCAPPRACGPAPPL